MSRYQREEVTFVIVEKIAVLSGGKDGWTKEINKVSWNGNDPKYDIRSWNEDHTKMGKGIAMTDDEIEVLKDFLNK